MKKITVIVTLYALTFLLISCPNITNPTTTTTIALPNLEPLSFDPPAGEYSSSQSITISTGTSGASIVFTTDGTDPTRSNGTLYTGAISINVAQRTIKAFAFKTGYTDSGIASAEYVISSIVADPDGYAIGDIGPSGVGIVFYITDNGIHGLEAAPHTWYSPAGDPLGCWSNVGTAVGVAAQGTAIGTGFDNTEAIITQDGHTESAADLCRSYEGGGMTDWFLPSRDELDEMNSQMDTIGNFIADQYWSSSEYTNVADYTAWFQLFDEESEPSGGGWKNSVLANNPGGIPDFVGNHIRPIRAF